jgi:hypothetical protein
MSHDYSGRLYLRQLHRAAIFSDQSSTAPVRTGDIQARAGASKLTASSSPADAEHFCRCSARKDTRFLVCRSCWWQVPEPVRKDFRFGDARAKRNAMRILLEFAGGRKAMREISKPVISKPVISRPVVSESVTHHASRNTSPQ